jgi:predicted RNA-binding Zn-ribbon protein involved in translation (DUF1610 family)
MDLSKYIKGRRKKDDPLPGHTLTDNPCPGCGKMLIHSPPCCSSPYPALRCNACGYIEYEESI